MAFYFDSTYLHSSANGTAARFASTYRALWEGAELRLHSDTELRAQYERALDALRAEQPYPLMNGTTDIYSSDQAHLIASGNRWNPRPIFQSYSAYNAALAEINRDHLLGEQAPDNVLLRLEPIDGHLPLSEDGPSWPELLSRYRPTAISGDLIYLTRREEAAPVKRGSSNRSEHSFGDVIALADSAAIDFVRFDIHRTWIGALVSFLLRIDSPRITLALRDGTTHQYRLVAKSAEAGFIASPLVTTTREALQLYSPGGLYAKQVKTLTIDDPAGSSTLGKLFWNRHFTITSSSLIVGDPVDLAGLITMDRMSDGAPAPDATTADCLGSLDLINGQRDLSSVTTGTLLQVDGWMDQKSPTAPTRDVYVTLTDDQGRRRYVSTHSTPRPDVAAFLKRPELSDAGYSTTVDLSTFEGRLSVGMAYLSGNRLMRCRQFAIPLTVMH